MASIKLKFRASTDAEKGGSLYYQVIQSRVARQIATDYRIYTDEWNAKTKAISDSAVDNSRAECLRLITDRIKWDIRKLQCISQQIGGREENYSADEIVEEFAKTKGQNRTVMEYMRYQVLRLKKLGRIRSSENCQTTLNSFTRFRNYEDLSFERLDKELMQDYEAHLKGRGVKRNTSSFYMRTLRMIYNQAVEDSLTSQNLPFKKVYTGIDKTIKRAIPMEHIKRIKELELSIRGDKDFARDMFMMSFYLRGMSFVDMAYLRKKDLSNGMLTYTRRKTGQQLSIQWERLMQSILDKYPTNPTQYLLPIIMNDDGTERNQYLKRMASVNRALKKIGQKADVNIPLSMYVARHSWASIARGKNISLSIISEGMGHNSEATTQIYLASIQSSVVDNANRRILKDL